MSVLRLLLREIQYRKLNFLLGLVSVTAAVSLPVAVLTMCEAADREITRLMRNMGFNVVIVPADTDMGDFWSQHYATGDMPEEYVHRVSESKALTIRHLVARVQRRIEWRGRKVLLTGVLPEIGMKYLSPKSKMGLEVAEGKALLGYELGASTGVKSGDTIELEHEGRKRSYVVDKCLDEQGSIDDVRIYTHLRDAQALLNMEGRISDIQALSCYCRESALPKLREDLTKELPDTKVTELHTMALARAETRGMIERYASFLIPAIVVICAIWVGLLALGNVRERRAEIGIMRAIGVGSGRVGALFLGKAIVVGLVGAAIGFPLGSWIALRIGPKVFPVTAAKIDPAMHLLWWSLIAAPLLCAIASYLPTVVAVTQDPAEVLREE